MGVCATIEGVSSYAELLQLQKLSLDSKSAKEICSCSRFSLPDSSSASNGLVSCCGGLLRLNCFCISISDDKLSVMVVFSAPLDVCRWFLAQVSCFHACSVFEELEVVLFLATALEIPEPNKKCSLGVAEDGIMTSELLEKQYLEKRTTDIGNANETKKSTTVLPKVCWLVMRCLADENESVRDAVLGAGHVLVEHYTTTNDKFSFIGHQGLGNCRERNTSLYWKTEI
ncbi:protein disulfide isomerase pTAC5, chloroplastic [Trifolium repens]|nr:protein disulfide isomerase pTAC5, chloroplastic [Trifolium repens]